MLFVLYGRKTVFLKMDLPCTHVYASVTDLTKAFDKDSHSAVDETEYSNRVARTIGLDYSFLSHVLNH